MNEDTPPPPRKRILAFVLIPVLALLILGGWLHYQTYAAATTTQQEQENFVPQVRTTTARKDAKPVELTLPGQTEAFNVASLYPRATGYVAERRVDIGSRVHKDDLLLRIAAPDLDQQLGAGAGPAWPDARRLSCRRRRNCSPPRPTRTWQT